VAAGELGPYLAREYGWPQVQQVGWVRRRWRRLTDPAWRGDETRTWITSLPPAIAGPEELARSLRGHWGIENGVHWVRDVTWQEDRGHGRAIGPRLATVRNTVINLLRGLGWPYVPDGRRYLTARRDYALPFLTRPLEH
jgi:predicted transposase YbfD/YdcC